MENFKKFIKELPSTAKLFENGDACIKRDEYVKGVEQFAYYHPTPAGFALEGKFWRGHAVSTYNHAKVNDPAFVPQKEFLANKAKAKAKKIAKPAKVIKAKAKKAKPAKAKNDKAIRNTADFVAALENDLKNNPEMFTQELANNVISLFKNR